MIKILLAFDHELPLGGLSKPVEDAIFRPTEKIIESAVKHDFKVTLFSDILCARAFRDNGQADFYEQYKNQLVRTISTGNDVQLHIHPHWVDTKFENGTFIPSSSFRLADFARNEENSIRRIVSESVEELTQICRTANPAYTCNSYRAGGYNLFPETKQILEALIENGIKIDSSIVKGFYYKSALSEIDFRNFHHQANWFLDPGKLFTEIGTSGLFEIPIASGNAGLITNLKHLYYKRKYKKHAYSTGKPIHSGKVSKTDKLKFVFSVRPLGFDVISLHTKDLVKILKEHLKKQQYTGDIYISTVSHPKSMGDFSINLMNNFVNEVRNNFQDVQFISFSEACNELFKS